MSSVPPHLMDVLAFLIPYKGSSISNVISQIVLAAMTYCLWNEHNSRLFKKKKSTADQIVQLITSLVQMKLVTFKFNKMTTGSCLGKTLYPKKFLSRTINPIIAQQIALDNALVAPNDRVKIAKCTMRIDPTKTQMEPTYQVALDTLTLSPCYPAFLITLDFPEIYMQQFWFTISKIKDTSSYQFKLDKKKYRIGVEVFCDILQIYHRIPNQEFVEPPSDEEIVSFLKELGYKGDIESVTDVFTDHMHQP
ncbi:hypothetical protein Tco_1424809 [Tanacetum coccineum]